MELIPTGITPKQRQDLAVAEHIRAVMNKPQPQYASRIQVCDRCACERHRDNMQMWGDQQLCTWCVPKCYCGEPMHHGGEGCCREHEIDNWLAVLDETEGIERIAIVTTLMDLDWVAK